LILSFHLAHAFLLILSSGQSGVSTYTIANIEFDMVISLLKLSHVIGFLSSCRRWEAFTITFSRTHYAQPFCLIVRYWLKLSDFLRFLRDIEDCIEDITFLHLAIFRHASTVTPLIDIFSLIFSLYFSWYFSLIDSFHEVRPAGHSFFRLASRFRCRWYAFNSHTHFWHCTDARPPFLQLARIGHMYLIVSSIRRTYAAFHFHIRRMLSPTLQMLRRQSAAFTVDYAAFIFSFRLTPLALASFHITLMWCHYHW
jgi:hypothetical protein